MTTQRATRRLADGTVIVTGPGVVERALKAAASGSSQNLAGYLTRNRKGNCRVKDGSKNWKRSLRYAGLWFAARIAFAAENRFPVDNARRRPPTRRLFEELQALVQSPTRRFRVLSTETTLHRCAVPPVSALFRLTARPGRCRPNRDPSFD